MRGFKDNRTIPKDFTDITDEEFPTEAEADPWTEGAAASAPECLLVCA